MARKDRTGIDSRNPGHFSVLPGGFCGDRSKDGFWPTDAATGASFEDDYCSGRFGFSQSPVDLGEGCANDADFYSGASARPGIEVSDRVCWIIDIIAGGFFLFGFVLAAVVIWAKVQ